MRGQLQSFRDSRRQGRGAPVKKKAGPEIGIGLEFLSRWPAMQAVAMVWI